MATNVQLPPHDIDAEEAVLASLMVSPLEEDLAEVFATLEPSHFYREINGWVYAACRDLWSKGDAVNQITVASRLNSTEAPMLGRTQLEEMGGASHLSEMIHALPTHIGVVYYANIVRECACRRQLIHNASVVQDLAYRGQQPIETIRDSAIDLIASVGDHVETNSGGPIQRVLANGLHGWLIDSFENPQQGMGITTGIKRLDRQILGFNPGMTYGISSHSSAGKSWLVTHMALSAARAGYNVQLFSMEMGDKQIVPRLVHHIAGIDPQAAWSRFPDVHWTDAEQRRLNTAVGELYELPISVHTRYRPPIGYLRSTLRKERARRKIDLVFIDNLHSMQIGQKLGRRDLDIGDHTYQFGEFAAEFECPVIYVAHQNRAANTGDSLNKLKDSSEIGQSSDVVMFIEPMDDTFQNTLSMDAMKRRSRTPGWVNVDIFVAKVRSGGLTGSVPTRLSWKDGGRWFDIAND